jgi:pimeloyl-ACP methyl ester carboxylesterase
MSCGAITITRVDDKITPFHIDVADGVLVDLRERLARTRWPDQIPGTGREYGADLATVQDLCDYWLHQFDWRQAEAVLNSWPQFETVIDDTHVHFIHARSRHDNAMPLVLTHGWPGSIAEFLKVLGPLTDPTAFGGEATDAVHVVAPSMPGYGFSGPTNRRGFDIGEVAKTNVALMARLGYERYGAQGGDWGAIATAHMGLIAPEQLFGIHLNMVAVGPPDPASPLEGVEPDEMDGVMAMRHFQEQETGYQKIQQTKPQSLSYGMSDSPAGLAGWIVEKFQTWTDNDGDVFSSVTRDELCTNLTIYWVTNTINSSMRLYYETLGKQSSFRTVKGRVEIPVGAALFPKELYRPPLAWAKARFNITHWTKMPHGGHFAALEHPVELVDDIRTFFRTVRP